MYAKISLKTEVTELWITQKLLRAASAARAVQKKQAAFAAAAGKPTDTARNGSNPTAARFTDAQALTRRCFADYAMIFRAIFLLKG